MNGMKERESEELLIVVEKDLVVVAIRPVIKGPAILKMVQVDLEERGEYRNLPIRRGQI